MPYGVTVVDDDDGDDDDDGLEKGSKGHHKMYEDNNIK